MFIYSFVGNVSWLRSPISLSLDDGVAKNVCHVFLLLSFALASLVDATIFVRIAQALLQPLASQCFRSSIEAPDNYFEQSTDTAEASDLENIKQPPTNSLDGMSPSLWWMVWTVLTMLAAALTTAAIGTLNDLIGIFAAIVACQTSISWPGVISYHLYERSAKRQEECYYHGSGSSPCRCSRAHAIRSPRFLLGVVGGALAIAGMYANSVDIAAHWKREASFKPFACTRSELLTSTRGKRGDRMMHIP